MASLSISPVLPTSDRRLPGILATVLVHAALILVWQMSHILPPALPEEQGPVMQWLQLPPTLPAPQTDTSTASSMPAAPASRSGRTVPSRPARPAPAAPAAPGAEDAPAAPVQPPAPVQTPDAEMPSRPDAATILENARRSVAGIDRALRKESKPLIVAPPDSPQLRMRQGMEQAHALAPPRLFEAPKVEELVNNTGDGARRTRVITGRRTYCITERSPATNITTIQMHGKIMLTTCPEHEEPAKRQEWRTARD